MPDPIDSVLAKLRRAEEHRVSAYELMKTFLKANPVSTPLELHSDRRWPLQRMRMRVRNVPIFPNEFGVMVGDAVHDIRSGLDHLMFMIARPKNAAEEELIQFPLYSSRKRFKSNRAQDRRPDLPRGAETALERLQPYRRRKRSPVFVLGKIREISNWDKHRSIPVMLMHPVGAEIQMTKPPGTTITARSRLYRRPLREGAVVAWVEMNKLPPGSGNPQVKMQPKLTVQPVFGQGLPSEIEFVPILPTIWEAIDFVEGTVIPSLRRFT